MKGDIVLKIIISFLIPFLIIYSFSCFFYINRLGILSILNCSISIIIAYVLFYLRFGKINMQKVISIRYILGVLLFCFMYFIIYLLIKLLD